MVSRARRRRGRRPRDAHEAAAREQILASARSVFRDVGYTAATFEEIARRSGLARASVTYYFASKSQLYNEAVAQPAIAAMDAATTTARQASTMPSQLATFLSTALDANSSGRCGPGLVLSAIYESVCRPASAAGGADISHLGRAFVASVVRDAVDRGELCADTDIPVVVDTLASIMLGVAVITGDISGNSVDPAATISAFERLCAHALWRLDVAADDAASRR
ncbi:TetR/AcrR family transcriptional regulator [Mycolicibacterium mucogenicum]|uniref:TetR/AcrR family transcriptional regulator n=1 Tax=Mycolicibacterium mucogenicum TaxID=56689 RepID=UPI0009ED4311|nr:TetR/AcrR family transcriptional regulator [Mycolicibacterium mucogenicum]